MKPICLALGSVLLGGILATPIEARSTVPKQPTSATAFKQVIRQYGSLKNAQLEYLHRQCSHPTASCHPSRALVMAKTLTETGANSATRPAARKQLAMLVKHLSPVERKDLQHFWRIEGNYQRYQQQRAKHLPAKGGTDRPRDPWLEKLARQQADREPTTDKAAP